MRTRAAAESTRESGTRRPGDLAVRPARAAARLRQRQSSDGHRGTPQVRTDWCPGAGGHVREPAVRVVRRLVGADVGDEPPLTTRGNVDERGEAREFGDQRDLLRTHRVVLKPDCDVRDRRRSAMKTDLCEDDIRGSGPSGAVGQCRRWQPRRDPCLHAAPQAADRTRGPIALPPPCGPSIAARIRGGTRYHRRRRARLR